MNHRELVKITADYEGTIKWLLEKKILPDKMICTCSVNVEMTLVKKTGKFFWRCCKCDKVKSILSDTIFYKSKLQPNKIIDLIYFWCRDFKQNESSSEIKTRSKKPCMEWYGKLQKLTFSIMKNEKRNKIGGVGKIIEIDESKFSKKKYNVGRLIKTLKALGGIDVAIGDAFFVEVIKKDSATLIQIILKNVELDLSFIMIVRGYVNLNNPGFEHYTVNHSENFTNLIKYCNTQTIEGL
ncbi:hypothetical protein H312_01828 [Anncaliia algerae PRA339]|uniref:ISXO2-like transposase domain-containing protein n=1 Tax=Anncaliia algerae PRA339 TaxID=1288291 RepID=A0A059F0R6_9MICR|nr:hypothetical protein H312_01828 [Anncaliia algerae PRA339]